MKNENRFLIGVLIAGIIFTLLFVALRADAQERVELLPFGDFEHWTEQQIRESKLIGAQTKTLYRIGGS